MRHLRQPVFAWSPSLSAQPPSPATRAAEGCHEMCLASGYHAEAPVTGFAICSHIYTHPSERNSRLCRRATIPLPFRDRPLFSYSSHGAAGDYMLRTNTKHSFARCLKVLHSHKLCRLFPQAIQRLSCLVKSILSPASVCHPAVL